MSANTTTQPIRSGSGLRMPRLLLRAITHRPGKLVAVVSALAVGATLASAFLSLYFDLPAKMTSEFRSLGPNILIAPPEQSAEKPSTPGPAGSATAVATLNAQNVATVRASAPNAAILPWLYAVGVVNKKTLVLAATELDGLATIHPSWMISRVSSAAATGSLATGVYAGEQIGRAHV